MLFSGRTFDAQEARTLGLLSRVVPAGQALAEATALAHVFAAKPQGAVRLGRELGSVSYADSQGRDKTVRYWLMRPGDGAFSPTSEVDELRWLDADDAMRLFSYDRDRDVLRAALSGDRVS